jgi:hypothetical protein
MNRFFVQLIGPHDSTTIGPFNTREDAEAFRATVPNNFDRYVLTEAELDKQFVEFGLMKIEAPEDYT